MTEKLTAGVAKIDITPYHFVGSRPLCGYRLRRRNCIGVHDPLHGRALVLDNGEDVIAMITVDILFISQESVQTIRKRIREKTGIEEENIIVACSHTHTGPGWAVKRARSFVKLAADRSVDKEWMSILCQELGNLVYMAWNSRKKAKIGISQGSAENISMNRRNPKSGPVDTDVGIIRIDSFDNTPVATLVNFTAHPLAAGPQLLISADYPGYAMDLIENVRGGIALFTNGAAGSVNPLDLFCMTPGVFTKKRDTRLDRNGDYTFQAVESMGKILGSEALKVAEGTPTSSYATFKTSIEPFTLPMREHPSVEEAKQYLKTFEKHNRRDRKAIFARQMIECFYPHLDPDKHVRELLRMYAEEDLSIAKVKKALRKIETEMQAITINEIAFVSMPGELFVEIALDIKRDSEFRRTFIIGYANDYIGYIPTQNAFTEGGYGADWSCMLNKKAEPIVKATALRLLNKLS